MQREQEFLRGLAAATPHTWVTPAIVALNVLVWLAAVASGVHPLSPTAAELLARGGNFLPVTIGQPWRLAVATVLHAGLVHLAFNMWALWDAGRIAERFYGNLQFLAIYSVSGLIGSLASLFFAARTGVSVGASGAVFGVVGALAAAVFTKHRHVPPGIGRAMRSSVTMFVGYSLLMGFLVPHIDNAAHVGGLIAGFLMGTVMAEKFDREEFLRSGMLRASAAIAGAMVTGFAMWKLLPAPAA